MRWGRFDTAENFGSELTAESQRHTAGATAKSREEKLQTADRWQKRDGDRWRTAELEDSGNTRDETEAKQGKSQTRDDDDARAWERGDRERRTDGRTHRRHSKTGKTRGQVERDADQMKTAAAVVVER
jgi:hypothetical protein